MHPTMARLRIVPSPQRAMMSDAAPTLIRPLNPEALTVPERPRGAEAKGVVSLRKWL